MTAGCTLFVNIFAAVCLYSGYVWCQTGMPNDCQTTLLQITNPALEESKATLTCNVSEMRVESSLSWISASIKSVEMGYLQVDLGREQVVTGIRTLKFAGSFQILFSLDGRTNITYKSKEGSQSFQSETDAETMHYLCPTKARFMYIVPEITQPCLSLITNVYGCNETWTSPAGSIGNLKVVSRSENSVRVSWDAVGIYDRQRIWYRKTGSSNRFYKDVGYSTQTSYTQYVVKLEPCTKYEIEVVIERFCSINSKRIDVTTTPPAPVAPSILHVTSPRPFTAAITWTAAASQTTTCTSPITQFIIRYRLRDYSQMEDIRIESATATQHTVTNLIAWQEYEFMMYSGNQFSYSGISNKVYVQVDGKDPEQPVKITSLESSRPDAFTIAWTNPPPETVNGQIKTTIVYFKKKSETHWKNVVAYSRNEVEVSPLEAGNVYQVQVALFNNKYNVSTDVREIFVGKKAPVLSRSLEQSVFLRSSLAGSMVVRWKIPAEILAETPEKCSVKVRKIGGTTWQEETIGGLSNIAAFKGLQHWRLYEAIVTVHTSRGVYYTSLKKAMVAGSTSEKENVLHIKSVVSRKPGLAMLTANIPEQFAKHPAMAVIIDCTTSGAFPVKISFRPEAAEFSQMISGLEPWNTYNVKVVLVVLVGTRYVFGPVGTTILVVGDVPGKPPSGVQAAATGVESIQVSWNRIPDEFNQGSLSSYSVSYSLRADHAQPTVKRVSPQHTSVSLTGLESETMYFIRVSGTNSTGGNGPWSDGVSATTLKDPQPPENVRVSSVSSTAVLLNWFYSHTTSEKQNAVNFTITATGPKREQVIKVYSDQGPRAVYSTLIEGLNPSTSYTIVVTACKVKLGELKCSDPSNFVALTTPKVPPPPTPRLIAAVPKSSTKIDVSWSSAVDLKEAVLNFTITAETKEKKKKTFSSLTYRSLQDKSKHRTYSQSLLGLEAFTEYSIHVTASKESGGKYVLSEASNILKVQTKEAAPSAPSNLAINKRDDEYFFSWEKPKKPNGIIRQYNLSIFHFEDGLQVYSTKIPGDDHVTMVSEDKFRPYQRYKANLRAYTLTWGQSVERVFKTEEGYPTVPRNVKATFNGTHLLVKWKRPKNENGKILRYKILVTGRGKRKTGTETYEAPPQRRDFFVKDSSYGTKVLIEVAAVTSRGDGPSSKQVSVSIDLPKPDAPPQPEIMRETVKPTSMVVKLKPMVAFSFTVSVYQVIVEVLNGGALTRRAVSSIPENVGNYTTAAKHGGKFYIAAEFEANNLPAEFVLGNGKVYNGYHNAPLNPETLYKVHVRAVAVDGSGNTVYGESTSVRLPRTAAMKTDTSKTKGVPLPIIAGIAGALLILVILVVIIILYLRSGSAVRRRLKEQKEPYDIELSNIKTKLDPTQQRPVSLTGDQPLHPDHAPISYANFSKHVAKMHRSDNTGFRVEYAQLEMGKEFSWENAHQQENRPKNRFANIVAYDHARVILRKIRGDPYSDFINASYIDGYLRPNGYVATQGPLPSTFNDFWRMIWELRSSVIVMLTNLQEKNKLKCHKYWPDDCIEYGDILVTLTRKEIYADYSIRTFLLEMTNSQESREVKHFHFTVWPDHGVPKYATAILAFRRRVRSYQNPDSGPTIVHCSAGVGRTGTYIALDAMLDRMNGQADVDIFNFVAAMRTRRIAMVQTEEQYIFIHDALLESVQCGNTEITAQDLRMMICRLEAISPETNMTGFEKEWKILNNVSPVPPKAACSKAASPENLAKNRNQNTCTLPADNRLVRLLMIEDDESTAYINAVYVDGYKQRNAFILTQSPLKNTVMDFWRMLCEHKSAAVVLLSSVDEGEDFVKFWPDRHIREYEMITVECLSKAIGSEDPSSRMEARRGESDLIVRQFRVEDSRNPEFPMMVKMFQFFGWTETKVPPNCSSIIHLINQLERWQQQSGNGPVTVICSDAIGRSGTFAALTSAIERVKVEQVVDVFQATKAMRIQRAHVVKTLDQYKFIYNSIEEYLNAFGDYANFK